MEGVEELDFQIPISSNRNDTSGRFEMHTRLSAVVAISALLATGVSASYAADLPVKAPPMAPAVAFTWTGFYIGANLGGAWSKFDGTSSIAGNAFIADTTLSGSSSNTSGVIGGGQVGYNWQFNNFVLGIEADIQGSSQNRTDTFVCGIACTLTNEARLNSFATVRGRIGFTPWERSLIYFTGGWAWMNASDTVTLNLGAASASFDTSNSRSGWTVGGGWEYMFLDHWSAKVEYLYLRSEDIDGSTTLPAVLGGGTLAATGHFTNNVVRVGVNYHF
jgi:outer membrane immunogenic protein